MTRAGTRERSGGKKDLLLALALTVFGLVLTLPYTGPHIRPTPDGLYYDAQKLEVQGVDRTEARERAFRSELAEALKEDEQDLPPEERRVDNAEWVEYSSQFYRRRWTVPVLAAAIDPVFGDRSVEQVALVGWALLAPLLFLLLRRRFNRPISAGAAAFCALLPPMHEFGHWPVTDSLGLSLFTASLLAAFLVRDSGMRWLPAWILLILALSFTRDLPLVAVASVGWLAWRERSRVLALVTGTGLLASLPAPLVFAAPLRENLAYAFNDYRIPDETGWGSILGDYPSHLWELIVQDLEYPLDSQDPVAVVILMGAVSIAAIVALALSWGDDDPLLISLRASAVAGLLTILISLNYTALRLELVFVPAIAGGLALLVERILARRGRPREPARRPPAQRPRWRRRPPVLRLPPDRMRP